MNLIAITLVYIFLYVSEAKRIPVNDKKKTEHLQEKRGLLQEDTDHYNNQLIHNNYHETSTPVSFSHVVQQHTYHPAKPIFIDQKVIENNYENPVKQQSCIYADKLVSTPAIPIELEKHLPIAVINKPVYYPIYIEKPVPVYYAKVPVPGEENNLHFNYHTHHSN